NCNCKKRICPRSDCVTSACENITSHSMPFLENARRALPASYRRRQKYLVATLSDVIDDLLGAICNVGDRVRSVRHTRGGDRGLGSEQRYQFQSLRLFGPVVHAAENEM